MIARIIPWLGVLATVVWITTVLVTLTMMWSPAWLSRENPPSEIVTGSLHIAAMGMGLLLGPALLFQRVRARLSWLQAAMYGVAFLLALASLWLISQ